MSKTITLRNSTSQSTPVTKFQTEVLIEIFKSYAKSYPEVRNERAGDLPLVSQYWNAVVNGTPHLWTKINLSFPFADSYFDAARERICTSKLEERRSAILLISAIPTGITISFSTLKGYTGTLGVYRGHIVDRLVSSPNPRRPSPKSISMEKNDTYFGMCDTPFDPQPLIGLVTHFGRGASLLKFRDLSLSAVHVDWDDALAGYQNFRKFELRNFPYDIVPSSEEFAEILSSPPRLEYPDDSGFCPEHRLGPALAGPDPEILVVHPPALRLGKVVVA